MSAELIRVYPIKPGKQVMSIQTIVWRKKSFLFWTFLKLHFFLWKASLYFDHSEANIWHILYFCLLPERWARNKCDCWTPKTWIGPRMPRPGSCPIKKHCQRHNGPRNWLRDSSYLIFVASISSGASVKKITERNFFDN